MWCKTCNREVSNEICEICGNKTQIDIPVQIQWCEHCKIPIIKSLNDININVCPLCNSTTTFLSPDIRPAFPAERLLFEILKAKPMQFKDCSVWVNNNKYYIDGKSYNLSSKELKEADISYIREQLDKFKDENENDNSFS